MDASAAVDSLIIRRTRGTDAEAMARLMSDEQIFAGNLQLPYAGVDAWRRQLEINAETLSTLELAALDRSSLIATAGLFMSNSSPRCAHVRSLAIAVTPAWQGKGVGKELIARLLDWSDKWIAALRIELMVYTDNVPAIALYKKFGFEIEGTMHAYALRQGQFSDVYLMSRLHPNPPQLPKAE